MALHTYSDNLLWEQVKQNDPAAFETLYRRYMRALLAAIYKWTENQAEAEDILQEVFLDVWERRATIQVRGQVFQYLYSITRYKVFDHIKGRNISEAQLRTFTQVCEDWVDDPHLSFDDRLAIGAELMAAELEKFPPQMKAVYTLRFRQEKSIAEIAEQLSVSPFTVKNHLKKIRQRLQTAASHILTVLLFALLYFVLSCQYYRIVN